MLQKIVGPIKLIGPEVEDAVYVPLATLETPLWYSVQRGAEATKNGINTVLIKDCMTRSFVLEAKNCVRAFECMRMIMLDRETGMTSGTHVVPAKAGIHDSMSPDPDLLPTAIKNSGTLSQINHQSHRPIAGERKACGSGGARASADPQASNSQCEFVLAEGLDHNKSLNLMGGIPLSSASPIESGMKQSGSEHTTQHHPHTTLHQIIESSSRYAKFNDLTIEIVGRLLYFRLEITTGNASGHNMVTKAADELIGWILEQYPDLKYISVSGNLCTDKKVSAINGIMGRGKHVIADIIIPKETCIEVLHAEPKDIVDLNIKKNLIGSTLAGSIRSANAHYANILAAIYIATGQDVANIVEGSQGVTIAELDGNDLYFSVNLPNIIVGTVGNGKKNLEKMGCIGDNSAKRLAHIVGATVLCGELSLLSALTNRGELMKSHLRLERRSK